MCVCVQGTLAQAVKKGQWILLDEINLAAAETLECLSGLLEGTTGSLVLLDRGDTGKCPSFVIHYACIIARVRKLSSAVTPPK